MIGIIITIIIITTIIITIIIIIIIITTVGGIGTGEGSSDAASSALTNAKNICDFALCVKEAVKHVKSPLDGTPIQLRMGINTGPVVAGVAGY